MFLIQYTRKDKEMTYKLHSVPTYMAYGGVPEGEAYGGEPQYIQTPYGLVKNDSTYKKYLQEKEKEQNHNNQGNLSNYTQYPTNFWGNSADNNYGFGNSDIEGNVEKMKSSSLNIRNPITSLYNAGHKIGELAADAKIAYDYLQKMKQTGRKLVTTYGPNQGADIDNYYHPLLQCQLAKISPTSRDWGLRLGYAKEIWDYHKKKGTMPMSEISADSRKDLQNNLYGSNLGYNNPNKSCWDMLDDRRTPNMRKLGIR